jgi:hypothetical protein
MNRRSSRPGLPTRGWLSRTVRTFCHCEADSWDRTATPTFDHVRDPCASSWHANFPSDRSLFSADMHVCVRVRVRVRVGVGVGRGSWVVGRGRKARTTDRDAPAPRSGDARPRASRHMQPRAVGRVGEADRAPPSRPLGFRDRP